MSLLLRLARLFMTGAALGLLAVSAAGLGGAAWHALDVINHAAPLWLGLALLGAVLSYAVFPGPRARHWAAAAFGFAALAQAWLIGPELGAVRTVAPAADAPRVRIVWLNASSGHSRVDKMTPYIVGSGADFVMLAEYHGEGGRAPPEVMAAYPHLVRCAAPHDCNVVILSKRAPVSARPAQARPDADLRATWAAFDIDGAPLKLMGAHLHRSRFGGLQHAQMRALARVQASEHADILAGDFNATPWSFGLKRFDRESGLTRVTRALPTWPAQPFTRLRLPALAPVLPIDHVYAGAHWKLVSVKRGPRTASDHYPIEAEFVWAP